MYRTSLASALGLLCVIAIASSTGCGGGGGGGGGGNSGALLTPRVTSVTPVDGATEISIHSNQIIATFDSDMDAGSINTSTFLVEDEIGAFSVTGTVAYDAALRQATWTLTQTDLNSNFVGQAFFGFDRIYKISLTSGIKAHGLPIVPSVTSRFRTAATEFGIISSGTDPQNNATDVLIDPYRVVVNGVVAFSTLKVQIDVALNPATVNGANVQLHVGAPNGTLLSTLVGFDTATNTIFVAPDPTGNPNPGFPGEPLLQTATAYSLVLTTGLQSAAHASPQNPLILAFTTINCQIRPPAFIPGSGHIDLVLAEAFSGPTTSVPGNASSDSNGDGTVSLGNDEFTEVVNVSSDYINVMGFKYADSGNIGVPNGQLIQWTTSTLPAGFRHLSLLAPGASFVIWNGPAGGPTDISNIPASIPPSKVTIGHSKAFFAGKFSGGLLANAGDTVIMQAIAPPVGQTGNVMLETFTNGTSGANLASAVLDGGTSGIYTSHRAASGSGGTPWSPGLKTNGTVYR